MANDPNDEAQWWAEFEQFGEESVRDSLHDGLFPEAKRQLAYRWLGAEAQKRLRREERSFLYLKLTLAAAIVGVGVGIIGIPRSPLRRLIMSSTIGRQASSNACALAISANSPG